MCKLCCSKIYYIKIIIEMLYREIVMKEYGQKLAFKDLIENCHDNLYINKLISKNTLKISWLEVMVLNYVLQNIIYKSCEYITF